MRLESSVGVTGSNTTYDYNSTDQLVRAGDCSLDTGNARGDFCIAYDYRGNTVALRGMRFRYDTSNRLTYQEAIPQVQAPANPLSTSPDGRRIVFASRRDGNSEIYTASVDGTDLRRLTNHPAEDDYPRFSPDGSRIVFVSTRDGNQEIYSMAADGTDIRRLSQNQAQDDHPFFSPDGTYTVFVSDRDTAGNTDLYKLSLNPDGSPAEVVRLSATPDAAEAWRAVSPDGQKIAFTRCVDVPSPPFAFTCDVATANPDGSGYIVITPADSFDYLPAWSPDSQTIAFSSGRDGNLEIYLMARDGADQRRLTNNPASDAAPAFLDQNTLVFVSDRDRPGEGTGELYRIRTDGTQEIRLSQDAMIGSPPSPGPLGQPQPNTPARTTISYDALSRPFIRRTTQGSTVETIVFGYTSPSSVPTYLKDSAGKIIWRTFMAAGVLAYADTTGSTPKVSFVHSDRRGDDIAETGSQGQTTRKNTYAEYGTIRTGPPPSPYGFLGSYGRFFDPQTSLYLLGARLYDPTLGRFLTRDPIPGGSSNDYEYGGGNPVMNADPSGTFYGISSQCYLIVIGGGSDPLCADAPPRGDSAPPVGGGSRMGDKFIYKDPMTGTYMIIDTRRGVIEARDLGRTEVVRRLWSKPSIDWSSVGKSFSEEIPFWGIHYKGYRCNEEQGGRYGCNVAAFLSVGTREAGLIAPNPYSALFTLGGMVVNPLMDVGGQFAGGARL